MLWRLLITRFIICFVIILVYILIDYYILHQTDKIKKNANKTKLWKNVIMSIVVPAAMTSVFCLADTFLFFGKIRNIDYLTEMIITTCILSGFYFIYIQFTKYSIMMSLIYIPFIIIFLGIWTFIFMMLITGVGP